MTDMYKLELISALNGRLNRDEAVPTDLHAQLVEEGIDVEEYVDHYQPNYYGDCEDCPTTTICSATSLNLPLT